MILSLLYGNAYYEFGSNDKNQFLQVRNGKGKITFKEFCLEYIITDHHINDVSIMIYIVK